MTFFTQKYRHTKYYKVALPPSLQVSTASIFPLYIPTPPSSSLQPKPTTPKNKNKNKKISLSLETQKIEKKLSLSLSLNQLSL